MSKRFGLAAILALAVGMSSAALAYSSIIALSVSTVTTGGTAVTALPAGGANGGGVLVTSNAAGICINQVGVAGTTTSGSTICVAANQSFILVPNGNAVSVNSTASSVVFAGWGLN